NVRIGIARALYSYYHYRLWQKFFTALNCQVILSPPTTKTILDVGIKLAPEEICLPIKTFLGHIAYLKDKCDAILIPRIVRMNYYDAKGKHLKYGCPKAIGLPDIVKAIFDKINIIDLTIDERQINQEQLFCQIGKLFIASNQKVIAAYYSAVNEQAQFDEYLKNGLKPSEIFNEQIGLLDNQNPKRISIGLIGHPYLIYDNYLSLSMVDILEKNGIKIYSANCCPKKSIKDVHWFYEQNIINSTAYLLEQNLVSGIIFAYSFSCGTSAVISEIIKKEILDHYDIPTLTLLFDEHSTAVGLTTRLESFLDLLNRNQQYR
ncbi:MAG: acyl-CoA dehydratase activase-related protein, partial [candidate division WOR-3 bacterium]